MKNFICEAALSLVPFRAASQPLFQHRRRFGGNMHRLPSIASKNKPFAAFGLH
ncbi:hypothetical protein GOC91_28755 [Sinorhizobium medicae]|uniref:hypothetical protein n=1 Tax=Sinorhizobium medicae TaxID=110321 RepID=UPI0012DE7DA1|nr:hypothetical protein [Sinorhizobium medicae]MBO1940280.1 hypothetical protein [Sinorhizobium medicae]MDX0427059.1 hypothetical protein [Sinorhizobium medicae]MDX0432897.1 hypothetical protein [Sinorhizobium medicae]MDX0442531.1 hypothetical protein [Sinorhizobium medicae]MDX0463673.1 hypothetical protein [Sinorhizobium medicae]